MINNLETFLTLENIYLLANWGVIPFWIMLILIPNHLITRIMVNSIIAPALLGCAYIFVIYQIYLDKNFFTAFDLYFGLNNLYSVFADENFLLVFWLHFLAISLFVGSWIVRDSLRHQIPRIFTFLSLLITYFTGPIGLLIYWFVRIFFAKKINFNE